MPVTHSLRKWFRRSSTSQPIRKSKIGLLALEDRALPGSMLAVSGMTPVVIPPAVFSDMSTGTIAPPATNFTTVWDAVGSAPPSTSEPATYYRDIIAGPEGDALRAAAIPPDFMASLDDASDRIIAHNQTSTTDISQPPAATGSVPNDWAYAGNFRLNNADDVPSDGQLQDGLHDAPVTVQPEATPQGFAYSRQYVLSASVGDQELFIDVTVESGVDVAASTEAGTLTTQVWTKSGGVYVLNDPLTTQNFSRSTLDPSSGSKSYLGLPSADGGTISGFNPTSLGFSNTEWDHVYFAESSAITTYGSYVNESGRTVSYRINNSSNSWTDATVSSSNVFENGTRPVTYNVTFGGGGSSDRTVGQGSNLPAASIARRPVNSTLPPPVLPGDFTHAGSASHGFHERQYAWQSFGGHQNVTENRDIGGNVVSSTLDYRNDFSGGGGYRYFNSHSQSKLNIQGTSIESRVDTTWNTDFSSTNSFNGYVDSQLNYDALQRPSGTVERKLEKSDTTTLDSYSVFINYFNRSPAPTSGSYGHSSINTKPVTESSYVKQTTQYRLPPSTTQEGLAQLGEFGLIVGSDGIARDDVIWNGSSEGGYSSTTVKKSNGQLFGESGNNLPDRKGTFDRFEKVSGADNYHTVANGTDNRATGTGSSSSHSTYDGWSDSILRASAQEQFRYEQGSVEGGMYAHDHTTYEGFATKTDNVVGGSPVPATLIQSDESHSIGDGWDWNISTGENRTTDTSLNKYNYKEDSHHFQDVAYNAAGRADGFFNDYERTETNDDSWFTSMGSARVRIGADMNARQYTFGDEYSANAIITRNESYHDHTHEEGLESAEGTVSDGVKSGSYSDSGKLVETWDDRPNRKIHFTDRDEDYSAVGFDQGRTEDRGSEGGSLIDGVKRGSGTGYSEAKGDSILATYWRNAFWDAAGNGGSNLFIVTNETHQDDNETVTGHRDAAGEAVVDTDQVHFDRSMRSQEDSVVVQRSNTFGTGEGADGSYAAATSIGHVTAYSSFKKDGDSRTGQVESESGRYSWFKHAHDEAFVQGEAWGARHVDIVTINSNYSFSKTVGGPENVNVIAMRRHDAGLTTHDEHGVNSPGSNAFHESLVFFMDWVRWVDGTRSSGTGQEILASNYGLPPGSAPGVDVTDLSWDVNRVTWGTYASNGISVATGLVEVGLSIAALFGTCGGSAPASAMGAAAGLDSLATGIAGFVDGQVYQSAIGYAASQGLQSIGVGAGTANLIGDLLPMAMSMGSSAFQKACFAAGTKLVTPKGLKAIEDLQPGDFVLSRNEYDPDGLVEPKVVEEVFRTTASILHLHIGGQVIRTTAEHPFFVSGKGWKEARELKIGDKLLCRDGRRIAVEDMLDTGVWEPVFNARIADHHTYFVSDEGWGWEVWSHNFCAAYRTASPEAVKLLRTAFNNSARVAFVKSWSKGIQAIKLLSKSEIAIAQKYGKLPKRLIVHHKLPLYRGGTNAMENLDVLPRAFHHRFYSILHDYFPGMNPYGL